METEKRRGRGAMSPVLRSPAKEYSQPELKKATAKVDADDPVFVPKQEGGVYILKAQNGATLPHRATVAIDCGVDIQLEPGWKLVVNSLPKWAEKGLIVTNSGVLSEGRIHVYVTNVGKEIIVIEPKDNIAQMTIEPLFLIDWMP